jgi:hypothetical protein
MSAARSLYRVAVLGLLLSRAPRGVRVVVPYMAVGALLTVAVIVFAVSTAHSEGQRCRPSDFEIKQLEVKEIRSGFALAVGEVVSHCVTPARNPRLRATLRASDGHVIAVGDIPLSWGGGHIEPGESIPFQQAISIPGASTGLSVGDLKAEGKFIFD